MRSLWLDMNRWLAWFHRWAVCFFAFFRPCGSLSGAVLHFVGFPSLPPTSSMPAAKRSM